MADDTQKVRYALPLTVARIEGTVTVSTQASGEKLPVRTSEVSLATEADRDNMHDLLLEGDWWKKREFEFKLAPDQRLTGAASSSTGFGAELVAAGLRVAAFSAKAFALFAHAVPDGTLQPVPIEEVLKREQPELARRRAEVAETIDALQSKLLALAKELGQPEPGTDAKGALEAVQAALTAARAEAKLIEAEFEAWRAERFPDWTTNYTYTIGVDRLPKRQTAAPQIRLTDEELGEGQVGEILRTLGVAAVLIRDRDPTRRSDTFDGAGVRHRLPRRCELAVYEANDEDIKPDDSPPLQLRRVVPAWIVDADSELGFVRFRSQLFEQHGVELDFADAGPLTRLKNTHTGSASAVTTALGGAGSQIVESLEQAGKVGAAFPAAKDPALKALEDQVARKELEAKLATALKTIAGAPDGPKPKSP